MLLRSLSRRCTLLILSNLSLAIADDQIENTPDAAIEDVAVLPDGFSPRYYLGASPARQFVKRQHVASCESGEHNCLDLGEASIPTPSGATISSDNSLSQSSKAGIGAGVAIGAALVIGAVTWFCIRRRRTERRRRSAAYARSQQGPTPGADTTVVGSMSEVSGPTRGQRIHPSGLVYDYFGPQATEGPYTQQEGTPHETPGLAERGVPLQPHGPGDIVVPVEMGPGAESGMTAAATTRRGAALARGASTRSAATVGSASTRNRDQQQDTLYELDAGFGSPSPLSQDEARQAAQSPEEPISPGYGTLDVDHYRDTH
ncbi:uncharacterized protein JN550_001835 [Neoarthrinium moseri]|uniref:uncharacterized protein n=1 Tax=Neoarthrinium moseri TaxID=1658444 RepID=UPI001FDAD01A|nr:uncharacterized protein JN550_001835 [Neoarthrinium moseri]KAI1875549.1 hypothetical protein JN550_001835 [Neoarthrinium moseri]